MKSLTLILCFVLISYVSSAPQGHGQYRDNDVVSNYNPQTYQDDNDVRPSNLEIDDGVRYIASEDFDNERSYPERGDIPLNTRPIYGWNCKPVTSPATTQRPDNTNPTEKPVNCRPVTYYPPHPNPIQDPFPNPFPNSFPNPFPNPSLPMMTFPSFPSFPNHFGTFGGSNSFTDNHFSSSYTQLPTFTYIPALPSQPMIMPPLNPNAEMLPNMLPNIHTPQQPFGFYIHYPNPNEFDLIPEFSFPSLPNCRSAPIIQHPCIPSTPNCRPKPSAPLVQPPCVDRQPPITRPPITYPPTYPPTTQKPKPPISCGPTPCQRPCPTKAQPDTERPRTPCNY